MSLTPAPNGAKEFNIALQDQWAGWMAEATESLSELAKEKKCSSFREGNRTQCLSSEEPVFDPSSKRAHTYASFYCFVSLFVTHT